MDMTLNTKLIQLGSLKGHHWDQSNETKLFGNDTNLICNAEMISEAQRKINDVHLVLEIWLSAKKLSANLHDTDNLSET